MITASQGEMSGKQLEIGQIYEISNFQVVLYKQMFKCFESTLQIVLTNATEVQPLASGNDVEIPRYVFHFTDLYQFLPEVQDKYLLHGK